MSIEENIKELTVAINGLTAAVKSAGTASTTTITTTAPAAEKVTKQRKSAAAKTETAAAPAAEPADDFSLDEAGFGDDDLAEFGLDDETQKPDAPKQRTYTGREAGDAVKVARDVLLAGKGKGPGGEEVKKILKDGKISNVQSIKDEDAINIVAITRRVIFSNGLFDTWKEKCSSIYGVEVV